MNGPNPIKILTLSLQGGILTEDLDPLVYRDAKNRGLQSPEVPANPFFLG